MTLDEAVALAKATFPQDVARLKKAGVKPYSFNDRDPKTFRVMIPKSLSSITANEIQDACGTILKQLDSLDGFWISGPDPFLKECGYAAHAITPDNPYMYIVSMFDGNTLESRTHFICWYHPV